MRRRVPVAGRAPAGVRVPLGRNIHELALPEHSDLGRHRPAVVRAFQYFPESL